MLLFILNFLLPCTLYYVQAREWSIDLYPASINIPSSKRCTNMRSETYWVTSARAETGLSHMAPTFKMATGQDWPRYWGCILCRGRPSWASRTTLTPSWLAGSWSKPSLPGMMGMSGPSPATSMSLPGRSRPFSTTTAARRVSPHPGSVWEEPSTSTSAEMMKSSEGSKGRAECTVSRPTKLCWSECMKLPWSPPLLPPSRRSWEITWRELATKTELPGLWSQLCCMIWLLNENLMNCTYLPATAGNHLGLDLYFQNNLTTTRPLCLDAAKEARGWAREVLRGTGRSSATTSRVSPSPPSGGWLAEVESRGSPASSTRRLEESSR